MRIAIPLVVVLAASGCSSCGEQAATPITQVPEPDIAPASEVPSALDVRPHCERARREAEAVLREADAWVAGRSSPVERWAEHTLPMRACFGVGETAGAWIFMPVQAAIGVQTGDNPFDPSESITGLVYRIEYDLTFIDAGGTRHVHQRRIEESDEVLSQSTRTRVLGTVDFDADGATELVWDSSDLAWEEVDHSQGILTFAQGSVQPYPPAAGLAIDSFEDWDGDGRLDIVTTTEFWAEDFFVNGISDAVIGVPPVLFHSAPDGTFTASDEVAGRYLREHCPAPPTAISMESEMWEEHAELAVACARLWGASAAQARAFIARELARAPTSAELAGTREVLEAHADVDPPQVFGVWNDQ